MRRQALTGLLAQVTQGAAAVGIILVIKRAGGSVALAGVVVGALSLAAGVARPLQGRMIDRRGAAGVMVGCGLVHPAAVIAIVVLAGTGAPAAALVALGVVAGLALPPVSTAMRVAWGGAAPEHERVSAFSLVYLTQELALLTGPLLLAALIALASPRAAVITVAAVAALGTLGFATTLGRGAARSRPTDARRAPRLLRSRAIRSLVAIAALLGGVIGAVEVGVPILASAHRAPAASGLLIAALSVGGIGAALAYGGLRWRARLASRLLALLSLLTACAAGLSAQPGLIVAAAVLLIAGVAINPALTTISLLADTHAPGHTAAEAFGWLSTGIAGGTGAANAIAGAVSGRGDAGPAFVVAAVSAAAAVAVAAAARRRLC